MDVVNVTIVRKTKMVRLFVVLTLFLSYTGCADEAVGPEAERLSPNESHSNLATESRAEAQSSAQQNSPGTADVTIQNPDEGESYTNVVPVDVLFESGYANPLPFRRCFSYFWRRSITAERVGSSVGPKTVYSKSQPIRAGTNRSEDFDGSYEPPVVGDYKLRATTEVTASCDFAYGNDSLRDSPSISNFGNTVINRASQTVNFNVGGVSLDASIFGPQYLELYESAEFDAYVSGGEGGNSYEWRIRYYANGYPQAWSEVFSTGSSTYASVNACGYTDFELEVEVTDSGGNTDSDTHFVDITNPC